MMDDSGLYSISYTGKLKIDPSSFDASICSLLICLDGEKYIDIFRSRNISQETLMELNDDDLKKLGVDDPNVREGLMKEIRNFPIYEHVLQHKRLNSDLNLREIANLLRDSDLHIHRIYLGMMSIQLALRRKVIPDVIVNNKRATTITFKTLDEITKVLNEMEHTLETNFQYLDKNYESKRRKKIMVGTVGGAVISVLAVLFVRALRNSR